MSLQKNDTFEFSLSFNSHLDQLIENIDPDNDDHPDEENFIPSSSQQAAHESEIPTYLQFDSENIIPSSQKCFTSETEADSNPQLLSQNDRSPSLVSYSPSDEENEVALVPVKSFSNNPDAHSSPEVVSENEKSPSLVSTSFSNNDRPSATSEQCSRSDIMEVNFHLQFPSQSIVSGVAGSHDKNQSVFTGVASSDIEFPPCSPIPNKSSASQEYRPSTGLSSNLHPDKYAASEPISLQRYIPPESGHRHYKLKRHNSDISDTIFQNGRGPETCKLVRFNSFGNTSLSTNIICKDKLGVSSANKDPSKHPHQSPAVQINSFNQGLTSKQLETESVCVGDPQNVAPEADKVNVLYLDLPLENRDHDAKARINTSLGPFEIPVEQNSSSGESCVTLQYEPKTSYGNVHYSAFSPSLPVLSSHHDQQAGITQNDMSSGTQTLSHQIPPSIQVQELKTLSSLVVESYKTISTAECAPQFTDVPPEAEKSATSKVSVSSSLSSPGISDVDTEGIQTQSNQHFTLAFEKPVIPLPLGKSDHFEQALIKETVESPMLPLDSSLIPPSAGVLSSRENMQTGKPSFMSINPTQVTRPNDISCTQAQEMMSTPSFVSESAALETNTILSTLHDETSTVTPLITAEFSWEEKRNIVEELIEEGSPSQGHTDLSSPIGQALVPGYAYEELSTLKFEYQELPRSPQMLLSIDDTCFTLSHADHIVPQEEICHSGSLPDTENMESISKIADECIAVHDNDHTYCDCTRIHSTKLGSFASCFENSYKNHITQTGVAETQTNEIRSDGSLCKNNEIITYLFPEETNNGKTSDAVDLDGIPLSSLQHSCDRMSICTVSDKSLCTDDENMTVHCAANMNDENTRDVVDHGGIPVNSFQYAHAEISSDIICGGSLSRNDQNILHPHGTRETVDAVISDGIPVNSHKHGQGTVSCHIIPDTSRASYNEDNSNDAAQKVPSLDTSEYEWAEVSLYDGPRESLADASNKQAKQAFQWNSVYGSLLNKSFNNEVTEDFVTGSLRSVLPIAPNRRPLRVGLSRKQKVNHLHKQ